MRFTFTPAAAIRWWRNRRGSPRPREELFVGRLGVLGPELYLVGRGARRLPDPQGHERLALALARSILAEVMHCCPATQLAREFADVQLEPVPPDGFVLSKSDVEAWLDSRPKRFAPAERGDSSRAG
jgi:hypothetical protein